MPTTEEIAEDVWRRIKGVSSISELDAVLLEIEQRERSSELDQVDALSLAHSALEVAVELSRDDVGAACHVIVDFLVPLCVRPQGDSGVPGSIASSNLRDLLADWIEKYPSRDRERLRRQVLSRLFRSLFDAATKETIWTIGVIGYRDPEVLKTLWPLTEQSGDLGDSAVNALAALGLSGEDRRRLIDSFCKRAAAEVQPGLFYALQELAGPELLDFIAGKLKAELLKRVHVAILIAALSTIADQAPYDYRLQERVWDAIRAHPREAQSSEKIAGRCNTPVTVVDYVRWAVEAPASDPVSVIRDIYYQRLADLVRPRQLEAWGSLRARDFLKVLKNDACQDTKLKGDFITPQVRLKIDAFETAMALGSDEPIDWLDNAVSGESSRHVQEMVLNVLATLQIRRLPRSVRELICDRFDATADDAGELGARAAAIRLAHSAGTREAFEVLLNAGLTFNGSVLLTTAAALADAATARVNAGDTDVSDRLLEQALESPFEHRRELAINALCVLGARRKLETDLTASLFGLLQNENLTQYIRCKLIEAIGFLPSSDLDYANAYLARLAETDGNIGFRAIEAIIRGGNHDELNETLLRDRLGLKMVDNAWSFPQSGKIGIWQAYLVGLLYQRNAQLFAPAIRDVLRHADSEAAFRVYPSIVYHGLQTPQLIIESLIERISERFRRNSAETLLFDLLAKISPDRLLRENWAAEWNVWLPEGRGALCDAIRALSFKSESDRIRAIAILSTLALDSTFAVRRTAFRALASVDCDALESSCRNWAQSRNVEMRERAAEAAAWISGASVDDQEVERIGVITDPERSVRKIAKGIFAARRDRAWALEYLEKVLSVRSGGNESVLAVYRYGRALVRLGDDDIRRKLAEHIANIELPLNVIHWLDGLTKAIDNRWAQETRKWPEPWLASEGAIEEVEGKVLMEDIGEQEARISLWCRWATGPSELNEWGAVIYPKKAIRPLSFVRPGHVSLVIPGREDGRALIANLSTSSNPVRNVLVVHGTGPYPAPRERVNG